MIDWFSIGPVFLWSETLRHVTCLFDNELASPAGEICEMMTLIVTWIFSVSFVAVHMSLGLLQHLISNLDSVGSL